MYGYALALPGWSPAGFEAFTPYLSFQNTFEPDIIFKTLYLACRFCYICTRQNRSVFNEDCAV